MYVCTYSAYLSEPRYVCLEERRARERRGRLVDDTGVDTADKKGKKKNGGEGLSLKLGGNKWRNGFSPPFPSQIKPTVVIMHVQNIVKFTYLKVGPK